MTIESLVSLVMVVGGFAVLAIYAGLQHRKKRKPKNN